MLQTYYYILIQKITNYYDIYSLSNYLLVFFCDIALPVLYLQSEKL
jgi:hypothetical protein